MKYKKGQKVWVNEMSGGKILRHEWYGVVQDVSGMILTIRDTNPKSTYYKEVFRRNMGMVERRSK